MSFANFFVGGSTVQLHHRRDRRGDLHRPDGLRRAAHAQRQPGVDQDPRVRLGHRRAARSTSTSSTSSSCFLRILPAAAARRVAAPRRSEGPAPAGPFRFRPRYHGPGRGASADAVPEQGGGDGARRIRGLGHDGRGHGRRTCRAPASRSPSGTARPGAPSRCVGSAPRSRPRRAALAAAADVVVCCLSDTPDVEAVLFGAGRAVARARGRAAWSSTARRSARRPPGTSPRASPNRASRFVDAPVSGGSEGAAEGTLTIMVGGEEAAVERAQPILAAMGQHDHAHGPGRLRPGHQGRQPGHPLRAPTWAWPKASCWPCRPALTWRRWSPPSAAARRSHGSWPTAAAA